jgi:hypothetical protein
VVARGQPTQPFQHVELPLGRLEQMLKILVFIRADYFSHCDAVESLGNRYDGKRKNEENFHASHHVILILKIGSQPPQSPHALIKHPVGSHNPASLSTGQMMAVNKDNRDFQSTLNLYCEDLHKC